MAYYIVKRHGLSMTGLFTFGLVLMLAVGGKSGQAQNNYLGVPIPQAKPISLSKQKAQSEVVSKSTLTVASLEKPLPKKKPKDVSHQQIVLASLTPSEQISIEKPKHAITSQISNLKSKGIKQKSNSFFKSNDDFVLKNKHQKLYRDAFDLQNKGEFKKADRVIKKIKNDILVGYFLSERYLTNARYVSSFDELEAWLKKYGDHPQARSVYKLMMSKKDGQKVTVEKPSSKVLSSGKLGSYSSREQHYKSAIKRSYDQQKTYEKLKFKIHRHVKNYEPTKAVNLLSESDVLKFVDDVEYDRMRASIASGYLYAGKMVHALEFSKASWKRSGQYAPLAGWVYGLTQWQSKNYKTAAKAFESAASSPYSSGWMVSASSFWAARAYGRAGDKSMRKEWLTLSATYPRTFYGIIASEALGKRANYNWQVPQFDKNAIEQIKSTASGERALALIDLGLMNMAEKELLRFDAASAPAKQQALVALAAQYNMPALSMRLGSLYSKQGVLYDAALFPWAPWEPKGGFRVDKALIHAIVRQESRFDARAANPSGATGLMQLMPATASYIAGHDRFKTKEGREQLKQPHVNLSLGQDYIAHLLKHGVVKGDLLSLAIAYNAGPGNLSRWKRERKHISDPLMFIETIPYAETRAFVERVLSNYWIYRKKAGDPTPSLQAVAKGKWAIYAGEIRPAAIDLAASN